MCAVYGREKQSTHADQHAQAGQQVQRREGRAGQGRSAGAGQRRTSPHHVVLVCLQHRAAGQGGVVESNQGFGGRQWGWAH